MQNNYNIFKNLILYTFVVLLVFFLYKIQQLLIVFFAGFILASAIDPLVEGLSKKIPRKYSLIVVCGGLLLTLLLFFIPFLNIFIQQILLFLERVPVYWEEIKNYTLGIDKWIASIEQAGILPNVSQIMSFASSLGQNIITGSIGLTKNFLTAIAFLLTTITVTLYMLIDKKQLTEKSLRLFPPAIREKTKEIFCIISKKVGGYVVSQVIIIFVLGLLVSVGLALIGVEFSLILGSLAAVLELIPIVGPIIAAVIIVLVALAQQPILAIWALVVYLVVEWLVDNFVRPFVFGKFLNIHPLTLILALFVGVMFFGVPGLILAPAGAAVVSVLIEEIYIKNYG
ncbi:MAG: hypothetical protein A2Y25_08005 [Candidatus Melainabacteria bacterium GWF2_37_15]|nr:MAG: hypothetical protein A2Y25_08005 [Candidatus Melainabacteria bacterium GWF2_37_15]